jgi:predicted phosphoadenosine phosphosulfate sulfurtransferase
MPADVNYLGVDVLTAARQRIAAVFDAFERVVVAFSGGKDSTVLLHLAAQEARARRRAIGAFFIDWEAQFRLTVDHVAAMFDDYSDVVEPQWIALPLRTTNACSMIEPEWVCWERGREADWVRQRPRGAIGDRAAYPFYQYAQTFEEFIPALNDWLARDTLTACLVGVRASESLNRWRTIAAGARGEKETFRDWAWTTRGGARAYSIYPLYDWRTEDIWTFHGRHPDLRHNPIYDLMHKAGLSLHQMRICEPYGDEQRRGLWLYHVLEPETWARVVARVAGANSAAEYARERGNILGNGHVTLPPGHTWQSFAELLLNTMPAPTSEHYKNKIAVWLNWWFTKGGYGDRKIPDCLPGDTGAQDVASWRRVCKILLKNDYWCRGLGFSPTKTANYDRYRQLMRERRSKWDIF